MQRRTLAAVLVIAICIAVDISWATLNYLLPLLLPHDPTRTVDITPLLPGDATTDWLTLMYLIPLLSLPLYVLLGSLTARWLVLPINRTLNLGHEVYYFAPEAPKPRPVYTLLRRALVAVVLMLGLSLTIAKFMPDQCKLISYTEYFEQIGATVYNEFNQATILMSIFFPILAFVLPASWLIEDCDIAFLTFPSSGPQELRNAGSVLLTLLKGFAGIFVLIDYFRLAINVPYLAAFSAQGGLWPWVPPWFFYVITFVNPFVYLFMPILALLAYNAYSPKLRDALVQYMKRIGTVRLSRIGEPDVDISEVLGSTEKATESAPRS